MNKRGVITVKLLLMISVVILFSGGMIAYLVNQHNLNQVLRQHKVQATNALMDFDTDLFDYYGLYGVVDPQLSGYFQSKLYPAKHGAQVDTVKTLDDSAVLKKQILAFMKFRMPTNYLDQFLSRLEIIEGAEASQHAIDLKSVVDGAFGTMDNFYEQQVILSLEINDFDIDLWQLAQSQLQTSHHKMISEKVLLEGRLLDAKTYLDELSQRLEAMEALALSETMQDEDFELRLIQLRREHSDARQQYDMMKKEYEDHIRDIQDLEEAYERLVGQLEGLLETHYDLLHVVEAIEIQEKKINGLVENTQEVLNDLDAIPDVIDNIKGEMTDLMDQMARLKSDVKDQVEWNIEILKRLLGTVHSIESGKTNSLAGFARLNTYDALRNKPKNPEDQSTYDKMKAQEEVTYESQDSGRDIPKDMHHETGGAPSFWTVAGVLKAVQGLYENITLNEYIVSTFKAFSASSAYDFDYFSKYERPSFFQRAEVEYILFGDRHESKNVLKTTGSVFAVRVIMNGIHVYLDKDKIKLSSSIGYGVAGWTGLGGALVTNVVRMGWATLESLMDMKSLIQGETVSFLKVYPEEWTLDIGLVKPEGNRQGMQFSYHDYLRVLLLTVKEETKLKRVNHLIELNLYEMGKISDLSNYSTEIRLMTLTEKGKKCETYHGYD